jgi:hypothetical protein
VTRSDDLAEFKLSYPAEAGAIPALARLIEQQGVQAETQMRAEADGDREQAAEIGYPYRPHFLHLSGR